MKKKSQKTTNQEFFPFKSEKEIKTSLDKQKLRQSVTSKPALQEMLKEILGGGMNWEIGIDIYTLLILCVK